MSYIIAPVSGLLFVLCITAQVAFHGTSAAPGPAQLTVLCAVFVSSSILAVRRRRREALEEAERRNRRRRITAAEERREQLFADARRRDEESTRRGRDAVHLLRAARQSRDLSDQEVREERRAADWVLSICMQRPQNGRFTSDIQLRAGEFPKHRPDLVFETLVELDRLRHQRTGHEMDREAHEYYDHVHSWLSTFEKPLSVAEDYAAHGP